MNDGYAGLINFFCLVAGFAIGVGLVLATDHTLERYNHVKAVTGYDDSRDVLVKVHGEWVVITDPTDPQEAKP